MGTKSRVNLSNLGPTTRNIYYKFSLSFKGSRFRRCYFVKVYTSSWRINCIKNQEVDFSEINRTYLKYLKYLNILLNENERQQVLFSCIISFFKVRQKFPLKVLLMYTLYALVKYVKVLWVNPKCNRLNLLCQSAYFFSKCNSYLAVRPMGYR